MRGIEVYPKAQFVEIDYRLGTELTFAVIRTRLIIGTEVNAHRSPSGNIRFEVVPTLRAIF